MTYPVELEERERDAEHIVLGKLLGRYSYWDAGRQNIFTLNLIEVTAWLKGPSTATEVGVITVGGTVGEWSQISHPSLELDPWNEYVLFLGGDNHEIDDKALRTTQPSLLQALTVADAQGAITKQNAVFHDLHSEPDHSESSLLARIEGLTGQKARTPDGRPFSAREGDTWPLSQWAALSAQARSAPITSFAPNPTHAGTINPADFITINGSGFGGSPGTVFYSNADDGGATFTASVTASDNLSWTDAQIQNKPTRAAGTGPINVNGAMTSAGNLTINYSHIDINSSFAGFGQSTRQAYRHVDKNGTGGYTFAYNAGFAANANAVAAFVRALDTWRCETNINFQVSPGTTGTAATGVDGTNVIFFNGALPPGVLGRANSFFQASATGACNQTNTVWWVEEIDIEFRPDPPAGCCTWNFGTAAPAFNQFDFESVAVHELGHAHGLGHVISPGAVMHFAIANGVQSRTLSTNDINGGNDKMAFNSTPLCFNPAGVNGSMVPNEPATCLPLPVRWLSVKAERIDADEVVLAWEVDELPGSGGFEVRRSASGTDFGTIGYVEDHNGGTNKEAYEFADADAPSDRTWYYQIVELGQNGQTSYSEVVRVQAQGLSEIEVFPIPADGQVQIRGEVDLQTELRISLSDVTGKTVYRHVMAVEKGGFSHPIPTAQLPNGIYLYRVSAGTMQAVGRLVVSH